MADNCQSLPSLNDLFISLPLQKAWECPSHPSGLCFLQTTFSNMPTLSLVQIPASALLPAPSQPWSPCRDYWHVTQLCWELHEGSGKGCF